MSFCLELYLQQSDDYEILLAQKGFKDCAKLIEEKASEIVYVKAGEKVLDARLIGIPPIPVGINQVKGTVLLSYTKPCQGTSAIEIPVDQEEIEKIRELNIK